TGTPSRGTEKEPTMTEMPTYHGRPDQPAWATDQPSPVPETPVTVPFWQSVVGIASILFGIALFAWPGVSVRLLGVLVGIWLLLAGIARIRGAFLAWRGSGWQVLDT